MVDFAFPVPPKEGESPPPSGLSHYVGQLEELAGEMTIIEEGPHGGDPTKATGLFELAVADTEKKILTLDRFGLSAPATDIARHLGFTSSALADRVKKALAG